jgi:hypothetical protein
MSKEYIERNEVLRQVRLAANRTSLGEFTEPYLHWTDVVSIMFDAPVENVEPRVEAEWILKPIMIRSPLARNYYCSNCKHEPIECGKYCPECGAKIKGSRMEGRRNDS